MLEVVAAGEAGRRPGGRHRAGCTSVLKRTGRMPCVGRRHSCCCASKQASALSAAVLPGGRCCQPSRVQVGRGVSGGGARAARRPWRKADTYHHSSNLVDMYQRKYRIFFFCIYFSPILHRYVSVAYLKRIRYGIRGQPHVSV